MQFPYKIRSASSINIFFLFSLFSLFAGYNNTSAQNLNPSSKKSSGFVSQEDREFIKIKDLKVKTRSKYYVGPFSTGNKDEKRKLLTVEKFSRKGMITEISEFDISGNVISNYKFRYDSKNRPVRAEGTDDKGRSSVQTSRYNSRGYEIERRLVSSGRRKSESRTLLKYDNAGNIIEIQNYIDAKLNDQQKFRYDKNKRIETLITNDKGDTALVIIPEYDAGGKIIREEKREGKSKAADTYKYDDKDNMIELTDSQTRRVYSYDDNKNVIAHKMFLLDGRRQISLVFKYNEKGLQNEQIRYDNTEKIVYHSIYEYEFYK